MDGRVPDTPFFEHMATLALTIASSVATWRIAISKKAVENAKIAETIVKVDKLDGRMSVVEDSNLTMKGEVASIGRTLEKAVDKFDQKTDELAKGNARILGILEGQDNRERANRR